MLSILAIIIGVSLLIGFHEYGHFAMARLLGMKVLRFSIGFGKVLARFTDRRGTEYAVSALPLRGYIKLLDGRESPVKEAEKHLAFDKRPAWQRALVILGGPLFNFILATVLFAIVFGVGFTTAKPMIGEVASGSIAEQAGLQEKDVIVSVNNRDVKNWQKTAMTLLLAYHSEEQLPITVQREEQKITYYLPLQNWELNDLQPKILPSLGITPYVPAPQQKDDVANVLHTIQYSPGKALLAGWDNTWLFTQFNLLTLQKMVKGELSFRSLGGPITIVSSINTAAKQHILAYLAILAIISVGLGILNLLPIPGLDGGQLAYILYEAVTGKEIPAAVQSLLFRLGMIAIVLIGIQVFLNDLLRIVEQL